MSDVVVESSIERAAEPVFPLQCLSLDSLATAAAPRVFRFDLPV